MIPKRIAELNKYVRGRADLSSEYLSEALAEIERLRVENARLRLIERDYYLALDDTLDFSPDLMLVERIKHLRQEIERLQAEAPREIGA